MCWGLGIRPHSIRGPLAKTGAHPTGKPSSNRHNGALLAPGRRDPVEHLFEHPVTRQRAPGGFDEPGTDTTGALAAHMAAPHRGPRRILARCQPRIAAQRPLIGKACQVAQFGRSSPGDHLANARDTPIHFVDFLRRLGLVTQQAAHLDELARGKAPLLGQQRETHAELRGQRPRGNLPYIPAPDQAPTGRGDQTKLVELGFDLAGNRGAVFDHLRAGSREKPCQLLGFRGDLEAAQATISQIKGQFLGVAAIRLDLIVGRDRHGRGIDDNIGDTRCGAYAV